MFLCSIEYYTKRRKIGWRVVLLLICRCRQHTTTTTIIDNPTDFVQTCYFFSDQGYYIII